MLWINDLARLFAAPLASTEQDGQIYGPVPGDTHWLQEALNRLTGANLTVDGKTGPATRAAVRAFQSANGLQSDGIAGAQTRAMLQRLLASGATARPATTGGCTGLPLRQVLGRFAFGQHKALPHYQPQIDAIAACLLASLAENGGEKVGHGSGGMSPLRAA